MGYEVFDGSPDDLLWAAKLSLLGHDIRTSLGRKMISAGP